MAPSAMRRRALLKFGLWRWRWAMTSRVSFRRQARIMPSASSRLRHIGFLTQYRFCAGVGGGDGLLGVDLRVGAYADEIDAPLVPEEVLM